MIPIGYMLKKIIPPPGWMKSPGVDFVYSVSGCVSEDFLDYIPLWKHNGWWLFDDPSELRRVAIENHVDLSDLTMFYYEAFEKEYGEKAWIPIAPEASFPTNVRVPDHKILRGYDVVTFRAHSPGCSPLSCNSLASTIPTNRFCLLDDFQVAYSLAEQMAMHPCEPGPYRVIAVYNVA